MPCCFIKFGCFLHIADRFKYNYLNFRAMDPDDGGWKKQLDKAKVVQKCPGCGELSLKYEKGKIICSECGFEQNVGEI